jgi:hypothetical protein
VITGIAVSQLTGDIYSMVKASQFAGPAQVEVFDPSANGNATPVRSFTDAASEFPNAQGIALSPAPPPAQTPEASLTALLPVTAGVVMMGGALILLRFKARPAAR